MTMNNSRLALITVIALFVNAVGVDLAPPPAAAALLPDPDPASVGPLPAWFSAASDGQHQVADPETYTDGAGWYRFGGLPRGTHKVTLDPASLPSGLRPREGEPAPVIWLNPGMEQTSDALSTGVRFTAAYDRESGDIFGVVFLDRDGDGRAEPGEPGLPGVRVVDPTLHQYFVPFDDRDLWTFFVDKDECHGFSPTLPLLSFIFVTAGSDGTVYYYDHWEDGYDADPLKPSPTSTTEVGVMDAGATQLFQSDIYPAQVGAGPPYYYDGRDRITIFGEQAAVVRLAYPRRPGTILAAAWEVQETADWGTEYVATVGEDLDMTNDHDYTGLEVMAWLDGTDVYYNGTYVRTLDAGVVYRVRGGNDGAGLEGVDSNDTITATAPIQVQMMTGSCEGPGVSAHGYTLQPVDVWDNAYWAPVPGFEPGCGRETRFPNADTDIYLHNPHTHTITVTVSSNMGTFDTGIPPATTVSVLDVTGWDDIGIGNEGVQLYAPETFGGIAVIDSSTNGATEGQVFDWGYSLVPASELSSQVVVGYAPGNGDEDPQDNGSLAFVTAITDTVIYVDLNQDGLPDPFDMNGNGNQDDYDVWGVDEWDEPVSALGVPVAAGQVLRVGDPNDHNLMGALIYTLDLEDRIAVAWGQDPCWSLSGSPYLDLGYTALPVSIPRLSKVDELAVDADFSGSVSPGDTITYTLVLNNNGQGDMNDVVLTDPLPYTYTDFVVGSLQVTTPPPTGTIEYYDGTSWGTSPASDAQILRITWPSLGPGQSVTSTFRVQLHIDIPVTVTEITNQAVVDSANTEPRPSEDPDDPEDPDTDTPVERPLLSIDKTVFPTTVQPGDRVTYTLVLSNYGNGVALLTQITDVLPPGIEYVPGTLDLTWPCCEPEFTTRTITKTASFHGFYADDFDLTATESTTYTGNDGSLTWTTNWTEVNDDGDPGSGEVQVRMDGNALSEPAHLWMANPDGDDIGVTRTFDLSQFQAPWLRYHVAGNTDTDPYRVEVTGLPPYVEVYDGDYTVQEINLATAAGNQAVTLGFLAPGGMDTDEYYRFDHISVYETQPRRVELVTVTQESTVLSYTTSTGGNPFSYDTVTGLMVITQGMRLPAGGFFTATFQAQVALPLTDGLTLGNTACTTSSNWLEILSPPCDDASVQVQSSHALTVTKTATPSPVGMESPLTYTLHYTITGDEAVEAMVLSDTTPLSTTFYAATPTTPPTITLVSAPPTGSRGSVIWEVSGLWPPGSGLTQATGTLTMVVLVDSGLVSGTLLYNAVTISDTTDLTATDEITTPVYTYADLAIAKTHAPELATPGSLLTYTLEIVNHGPNEAEGVVVNDTLPPEVTFITATTPVTVAPPDLAWPLGTMAVDEVRHITVTVQVGLDVTQTFTNTASVTSDTPDPDPDNNHDDEPTSPPRPGLELIKTVEPYHAARDMPFTYRLRIVNTGDFTFDPLVLTDTLPSADFHYIRGSGVPADADPIAEPTLVWQDLGPLAPGESLTVSFQVRTTEANGTYTNTATVEGVYPGGTLTDTDDAPVAIADPAVAVDKGVVWVDRDDTRPNYVTFTIAISNVGPSTIDVLPLLDQYDINYLEFQDATPYPEEDENDGLLSWHDLTAPVPYGFGRNLPPEESLVVTTVFLIVQDVFATTNTATITGAIDIYGNPADPAEDDVTIRDAPTPVELLYFRAVAEEAAVRLEWATAAEVDTRGFRIYRAPDASPGDRQAIAYIPATGPGSTYSHVDRDVTENRVYWYWLADVDADGDETFHGPVWGGVGLHALPVRAYLPLIQKRWTGIEVSK
jgi:uncharacterized repeat protein (TIGR01451 family)